MNQEQKCSQCLSFFTLLNPPRLMPSCEHNICTKCLKQAIQHRQQFIDCGFCGKKIKRKDIKLFQKNMKLIEKVRVGAALAYSPKDNKNSSNSNANHVNFSPAKQEEELLIGSEESHFNDNENKTMCETHKKRLQIICATQRKMICSHCAIFGNHKDHRFKTIAQFQEDISQKTQQFQQITKKKQQTQTSLSLNNMKVNFNVKIDSRKSLLQTEIQKTFEDLISSIRQTQKSIQKELDEKFDSFKVKVNENLSSEIKLKKNYISWQTSCQEVINKLKMTNNPNNRIQIYFDSPLEICEEGTIYLDDMIKSLSDLYKEINEQIDAVSIKTEEKNFDDIVGLVFPLLQESTLSKELLKIQESFEKDFPNSKNQPATREDLEENSFIFESQVSAIQLKQPKVQKRQVRNRLNKSQTSMNSITNLSSIFGSISSKNRISKNQDRDRSNLNKTKTPQRRFGSPDFSKTPKTKQFKTPEQILISLATNDFINEIDLSELSLKDKEIKEFLHKAKNIRPIKAIKLQQNSLTDEGFESICQYLDHVSNLNLSFNHLTDRALDIILKNKEYFYKMRIMNLSNNKITSDKTSTKIKGKMEELKRMGIVVTL